MEMNDHPLPSFTVVDLVAGLWPSTFDGDAYGSDWPTKPLGTLTLNVRGVEVTVTASARSPPAAAPSAGRSLKSNSRKSRAAKKSLGSRPDRKCSVPWSPRALALPPALKPAPI